ncbi:MAG: peptide deformylase [Planctomycetia bacterium]|nr:peptide deformylase [Planctomycetia bacterium]
MPVRETTIVVEGKTVTRKMETVIYPHPMLKHVSKPIRRIDEQIREIVSEMFQIMYKDGGVGLAANQVNLPYQLFVMNETADPEQKEAELCFINPVITKRKGREEGEEGCLSFPDLRLQVVRSSEITFQAINLDGELVTHHWKGWPARIVQHETDHLFGRCFYERAGMAGAIAAQDILRSLELIYNGNAERGFTQTEEEFLAYCQMMEAKQA